MNKISKWKIITSILFTVIAFIYVLPNFTEDSPDWLPGDKVNLGLDLRGGSHLLLSVDFDSYMDDISQSVADGLRKYLRDEKIGYRNLKISRNKVQFDLRSQDDYSKVKKAIRSVDSNLSYGKEGDTITLYYNEYAINQLQDKVIDQSIEIVRMRVDSTGTKEPNI